VSTSYKVGAKTASNVIQLKTVKEAFMIEFIVVGVVAFVGIFVIPFAVHYWENKDNYYGC
jgi:hypothetical protein